MKYRIEWMDKQGINRQESFDSRTRAISFYYELKKKYTPILMTQVKRQDWKAVDIAEVDV